jgi:diguanylate cyclase (GGDEF)-like protein/PAS domain S-box-containing protein
MDLAMIMWPETDQEELTVGVDHFRSAFIHAAAGMALATRDGRFARINPAFCAHMGYTERDLMALDLLAITHPDDRQAYERQLRRLLDAEVTSLVIENRYLTRSGVVIWARTSISQVPGEGMGPDYFVVQFEDVTEHRRTGEMLEYQASHDELTGLPNRARLCESIEATIADESRRCGTAALLWIDLDHFKDINDTFGHHYGDRVLKLLNPRFWVGLREGDLVARLGGDEFAILLPGADREGAVRVAERVLVELSRPIELNGHRIDVGASVGIALFPEHGQDPETLMRRADVAMYAAKRARAGQAVYAAGQSQCSPRRLELVAELRQGIEDGNLLLHYQPKIDLKTGKVLGAEALVRWQHPTEGMISPDLFIPMAEQTGLIRPLSHWVLETALARCAEWSRAGQDLSVAVNITAESLQDPRLNERIAAMLSRHGVSPGRLTLEVTESAMMADPARAKEVLGRIHEAGVRISIDDFGTGYSSLAYLKDLPVHEVKIDQKFVRGMRNSQKDACIVRSVIDLGHNFGLRVVAEGAEDQECSDLLVSLGCDVAQGFHFSRPLPPAALEAWLTDRGGRLETLTSLPLPPPLRSSTSAGRDPSERKSRRGKRKNDTLHDTPSGISDRRHATRYPTRNTTAVLGWLDGCKGCKLPSSLKNISASGALVETEFDNLPLPNTNVMIRLVSNETDWVMRAQVVDVYTPQAPGRFSFRKRPEKVGTQVRLRFLESCPYEFFKASISGFVVQCLGVEPIPETSRV